MDIEKMEDTIIVLEGMKVICGLCRTEKEAIDDAIEIIQNYISIKEIKDDKI